MVICQEVTSYVSKCSNDVCQIIEREGVVYPLINSLMQFETSGSSTEMVVEIFQYCLSSILISVINKGLYIVCNADFKHS